MAIRIIADGAVSKVLEQTLDGTVLSAGKSGSSLSPGDTLVVCAHGWASGARRFTATGGLEQLDRLLGDPDFDLPATLILSFQTRAQHLLQGFRSPVDGADIRSPDTEQLLARVARSRDASIRVAPSLLPFERLPVAKARLQQVMADTVDTRLEPWQEWLLRLQASRRLLSTGNAAYRHEYKNLIAAVRIYLGALQAGATPLEEAENVLEKLARKEKEFPGAAAPVVKASEMSSLCRRHRKIVERVGTAVLPEPARIVAEPWRTWHASYLNQQGGTRPIPQDRRVLMLDDQCINSGWVDVLESLAEDPARVTAVVDWESAKSCLRDLHFDLMLIDCNLGSDKDTGLELLLPLREFSIDLPIVMMTAYDDAELALWALRSGANDFYAKSLEDSADRDSLDYFLRFKEVINRPKWEKELRECWLSFRGSLPLHPEHRDNEARIRYAFYLLFSLADGTAWWAHGSTALSDGLAVRDWICRTSFLSIATAFAPAVGTREYRIWMRARHTGRANSIAESDAMVMLHFGVRMLGVHSAGRAPVLDAATALATKPKWPEGCRIVKEQLLKDDPAKYPAREPGVKLGHLQRSSLGAVQFLLGSLAEQGTIQEGELSAVFADDYATALDILKEAYPDAFPGLRPDRTFRVVLIDDDGNSNGWPDSLSRGLGQEVRWYSSVDEYLRKPTALERTDLVLLDLWLIDKPGAEPSAEAGLAALRTLKAKDPGLPVLVLSAATDTVNAIRCMKLGALDYVAKWLPGETGVAAWKEFSTGLKARIAAASLLGRSKLRQVWKSVAHGMQAAGSSGLMSGPPDAAISFPQGWEGMAASVYWEHILPALVLYNTWVTGRLLNGQMPSLDSWRVKRVLLTRATIAEDIVSLTGRAAEYLGWVNFSCNSGELIPEGVWKTSPEYRKWIGAASPSALTMWDHRNWVKDQSAYARPPGWEPKPELTMDLAVKSLEEFFQRVADGSAYIAL